MNLRIYKIIIFALKINLQVDDGSTKEMCGICHRWSVDLRRLPREAAYKTSLDIDFVPEDARNEHTFGDMKKRLDPELRGEMTNLCRCIFIFKSLLFQFEK